MVNVHPSSHKVNPWIAAFLRLFFRLLYHEFSFTYDMVAKFVSLGMWNDWVLSALPFLNKGIVLELGHGPGHLQVGLLEKGIQSYGLDRSSQMGHRAFRRLQKKGLDPKLTNGYAQFTPFPSNHFNHVVSTFPSEYILDPKTLAEVHRILKPGGSFIIIPVAWITGRRIYERWAAWLFRVTGQTPAWDKQLEFELSELPGFSVILHQLQLPSSLVIIIEAIKLQVPRSN